MIIRYDIDPCMTPLSERQVQEFIKAGIRVFHNSRDHKWYLNKYYFQDQHPIMQEALRWIIVGRPTPEERFDYAAKEALEVKAELEDRATADSEAGNE